MSHDQRKAFEASAFGCFAFNTKYRIHVSQACPHHMVWSGQVHFQPCLERQDTANNRILSGSSMHGLMEKRWEME